MRPRLATAGVATLTTGMTGAATTGATAGVATLTTGMTGAATTGACTTGAMGAPNTHLATRTIGSETKKHKNVN